MSRSRFLLLPGGGGPPGAGAAPVPVPVPAATRVPLPHRPRQRCGTGGPAFPWRAFACPLAPGRGWPAARALTGQATAGGPPPRPVILDLAGSAEVTEDDCEALCWLHEQLAALGSQLWLAAAPRPVSEQFAEQGVAGLLGAAAIHPSLRAAVLAAFAALPGPGLVTSPVRLALTAAPEPLPLTPARLVPILRLPGAAADGPAVPGAPERGTAAARPRPWLGSLAPSSPGR